MHFTFELETDDGVIRGSGQNEGSSSQQKEILTCTHFFDVVTKVIY